MREAELLATRLGLRTEYNISRYAQADILVHVGRPGEAVSIVTAMLDVEQDAVSEYSGYVKLTLAEALMETADPPYQRIKSILRKALSDGERDPQLAIAALVLLMEAESQEGERCNVEAMWREINNRRGVKSTAIRPDVEVRASIARVHASIVDNTSVDVTRKTQSLARQTAELSEQKGLLALAARAYALLARTHHRLDEPSQAARSFDKGNELLDEASRLIKDQELRQDFLSRSVFRALRARPSDDANENRLMAIYDMIRAVNSETDPDQMLETILDMALRVVHAERGMILLRRGVDGEYTVRSARDLEQQTILEAAEFSRNVVLQAAEGRPVLAVDTGQDERLRDLKSVSMFGIRSVLCVPLRARGEIIGAVYLDSRTEGALFSADDLRFLEAFADHAALALENAQSHQELERENVRLQVAAESREHFGDLWGRSTPMQRVYDLIAKVADTDLPVLIQGESGTGKELVANAIHARGSRRRKPFLTENCAAIPESLLESELFGHVEGAFTGAERDRKGLFEQADGGTLFLDEVGDMSPGMQARLLRVLQEGELRPVGGEQLLKVDVRVLAATHHDLQTEVGAGRFREDLFYRLQVLMIQLPPLRERVGDVPLLAEHFLRQISDARGRIAPTIQAPVMDLLERHPWPGNVRQMENILQRLVLLADDGPITLSLLKSDDGLGKTLMREELAKPVYSLEQNEREQIQRALEAAGGNRTRAAEMLGISRATIFRKIKEMGL
jgi:transcriptional regulator with GAF, ATPase, and Fis domain